jgi:gliding motility-associated-like protein
MKRSLCIAVLLTLLNCPFIKAQTDTLFWFAAPEISQGLGDRPILLYFNSYSQASAVTVSFPARTSLAPITRNLAANAVDSVDLTSLIDSIENSPANAVNNQGILIQATKNISAYYMVKSGSNKEIFTLKGQKAIGTDFFTPFQKFWNTGITAPSSFSSVEIVATQNNTTVLITPRNPVIGHVQNTSFSVVLNKGQTFSLRDTSSSKDSTLSGSIISSNNPVAVTVYSGAVSAGGCLSTLGDQLTNSSYIGTDYVINRGNGNQEAVFILATQNNTSITISDGVSTYANTINWLETDTFTLTQPFSYIHSTKPVYVWQVTGFGCSLSGAQVPAMYCSGSYSVAFNRPSNDSFAVNLFTRSGYEGNFLLNGVSGPISPSAFSAVPGSGNMMSARIFFSTAQIAPGTHNLITNTGDIFGCSIQSGSSTAGSSFGYITEFTSYPYINAGPDTTLCSNASLALNGQIGGGNVQGVWSTNGFGTFVNGTSSLVNTYQSNALDTLIHPVQLILTTIGPCRQLKDTVTLTITPQPLVNAGPDQIVCANNANALMAGSVSLGSSTGAWTTLGTGIFTPNNTVLSPVYVSSAADTSAGQVTLILTSTNNGGCQAVSDTMKIIITDAPIVDAGPATVSVCANNAIVSLNGSLAGSATTAKWTSSGTGAFTPNNLQLNASYSPSTADISAGQITIKLTSTNNGQCKAVADSILVTFTPKPSVNAGADMDICVNVPSVNLNGAIIGATNTGTWSGGNGTYSPNDSTLNAVYTPTASEISAGTLILTLTSTNNGGCLSENDAVQINFRLKPSANFTSQNLCLNNGSTFTDFSLPNAGSLASWNWNFGDGGTSVLQNPSHTYTSASAYSISLIVKNSYGCYDTTSRKDTIFALPVAAFGMSRQCSGNFLNLNFTDSSTVPSPEVITSWFWDFGGVGNSTQQNPTHYFPGQGNYYTTLIVTTAHGCKDTLYKPFSLLPRAQAGFYFTYSQGQSTGTSVSFVDTSKYASSWNWSFGDNPPGTSTLQDPIYLYYANGNYVVTQVVHDAYGCTDTAKHVVKINNVTSEITQLIPNAITPNGDGKNDYWNLDFIKNFYPNAMIEVYNRWGEKVFSSVGYATAWDGTYQGHQLPIASYYYVITLNDPKYPDPFKGSVLIIR